MGQQELTPDQKGQASLTLGEVIVQTRNNFPHPKYRPQVYLDTPQYHLYGIDPSPHQVWPTVDGIGTKPELAERLTELNRPVLGGDPDYTPFETLAYDVFNMIDGDEARWGRFLLGVAHIIDTNKATPGVMTALAKGSKQACDEGGFALLNGETAELGYRTSGYGESRINWGAMGLGLVVPYKLILGTDLAPGQLIVGFLEDSIRSNGLSKARAILEAAYLSSIGYASKKDYFLDNLAGYLRRTGVSSRLHTSDLHQIDMVGFFDKLTGHDFLEQMLIPWHEFDVKVVREILRPSTFYGRIIQQAQGGVDGEKNVEIVAAAHITGGGIPEKIKRMVEHKGLGAHLDAVFPDPPAVTHLLDIARHDLPRSIAESLIDDRRACEQWNRGTGFVAVTKTKEEAHVLCGIGQGYNVPMAIVGEILPERKIEWRGHTWTY